MSSSRLSLADLCQPSQPSTSSLPTTPLMVASPSTPVHAGTKRPLNLDDQDEDVRIAVRALGDMRSTAVARAHAPSDEAFKAAAKARGRASSNSKPPPLISHSSTSTSTSCSSPISPYTSLAPESRLGEDISPSDLEGSSEDFVSRVSHLPLVNTALKAYSHSKERSRVVKYGANFMESSVKTLSRPVIDRLPVGQLDDFACRQLDRFGYPKPITSDGRSADSMSSPLTESVYRDPPPPMSGASSRAPSLAPSSTDDHSTFSSPIPSQKMVCDVPPDSSHGDDDKEQNDKQVASRSKWQAMLLEAGGISAAISEESMKRLQYCLQWLQYATSHIDSQILILRSFIDSLSPRPPHENDLQALVPLQTMRSLTDVRRDVISTIRQVVEVISRYAGSALPEPARASVRSFILRLPMRWANANSDGASVQNAAQAPQTYPTPQHTDSESSSRVLPRLRPVAGRGTHPTAGAATQAAQRILTLATESLDMMRSVTAVFKESLDKAEAWVERLRVVGLQRQGALSPPPTQSSSPSTGARFAVETGRATNHTEASSSHETRIDMCPPLPTSPRTSSSMPSMTNLSIASQTTTSPPTSVVSGILDSMETESSVPKDTEGETEGMDTQDQCHGPEDKTKSQKGAKKRTRRSGSRGMGVDD